jgi:4-amino-4-deoxy-L-arabinose transferase-like glycosyltransferase
MPRLGARAAMLGLLLLAAGLRLWGLGFGLPYFEHPDEWAVADEALRILRTGDWSPFSYTYPTLYVYLEVGVAALHYLWGAAAGLYHTPAEIDPARFYLWARALTAALGVGCVALTYRAGQRLYSRAAGLIAAALLAVVPSAVADAHYVTVDTPAAFFTLLAFLAIAGLAAPHQLPQRLPVRRALLAGLATGLAASTKYTAGVLVVALVVAALLATRQGAFRLTRLAALALVAGAGTTLGFTLGTPLWLVEWPRLLADLRSIAEHYRVAGHPGAESSQPALFYWGALRGEAWMAAWLVPPALALALARRTRADWLVLAVVVPFVLQLSSVRVVFVRNAMPLLPFACLLVGALVAWLAEWAGPALAGITPEPHRLAANPRLRGLLLALVAAALLAQPLAKALRDEWLRAQPTTRLLATAWVRERAPDGTRVWLEDQTLILSKSLRVEGGQPITSHTPAWYRENGFRFLVANDSIRKSDPALLAAFGEPAARFAAQGQRLGHTFLIFDTGVGDVTRDRRTSSGATLGGGAITLDGYRHPDAVAPGERLPLALYWRANQAPAADYTVFVHLLDASGAKLAQRDLPPLDGSRPTSSWKAGELLRDDQDLPIPADTPPGTYQLVVGMYDATTLPPINDTGPIAIGTVEVR